jgi:hypothetical protein
MADGQPALGELHVGAVKRARLRDAHAAHRKQPDHRLARGGAQRRTQSARGVHQRLDLRLREQIGHRTAELGRQQIDRRHLVAGVERVQVDREAAHHRQPLVPPGDACLRRLRRELERQLGGDQRRLLLREELDKLRQHTTVIGELVSQRAAHRHVVLNRLGERGHRSLPGHGSANPDNARRSTLA